MKTSTKVIIKFQVFTSIILFIVLFLVNILFFEAGILQYDEKIQKIEKNMMHMNLNWWKMKNWQILKKDCFVMYQENYCLSNWKKNIFWIYHIKDSFFYLKNSVVFDITDFFEFQRLFVVISFFIFLFYLLISYFLWEIFLKTIYNKIFKAIDDLKEKNYIDVKIMKLSNNDELKILFETINHQIKTISSFNKYLSHELKTPLMKIVSTLDLLNLKYNDEKIPELKKELFFIKDVVDALNKLILIETRNYKIEKEDFNICNYLENYIQKIDLNDIFTSKELFSLVLKNLLENLKKYAQDEIKILIDETWISFENKSKPIKDISKLTDKFYKEWENGLWIGLYLSKKICDILGYSLEISYVDGIFRIKIIF